MANTDFIMKYEVFCPETILFGTLPNSCFYVWMSYLMPNHINPNASCIFWGEWVTLEKVIIRFGLHAKAITPKELFTHYPINNFWEISHNAYYSKRITT